MIILQIINFINNNQENNLLFINWCINY